MTAAVTGARRARWTAASALVAALFVASQALLWLAYYGGGAKRLIGDEQSYQAFALAILGGGPWMPSSIWPPLQSLLLAAIYAAFGVHVLAAQLVQTLLFVGCALLLRGIWREVGGSVRATNIAAALFLVDPANAAYAHWLWPEVPHLFLVLLAFRLLLAVPASRARAAVAGACTGLALLAKSLLAGFWPMFLIAFVRREHPRFRTAPAAAFLVALALVTAPALWHGWREYGRPMIADSSIYNLWIGLTDRWRSDYVEDMGGATLPEFLASGDTPEQRNAIYREKARAYVQEHGIATVLADQLGRQYFRLFSAKTPLVSQLPGPACAGHLSVYATPPWLTSDAHPVERCVPRADPRRGRVRPRVLAATAEHGARADRALCGVSARADAPRPRQGALPVPDDAVLLRLRGLVSSRLSPHRLVLALDGIGA